MKNRVEWNKVRALFVSEVNVRSGTGLLIYFVATSLLELLAYAKGGSFSVIASRIWIVTAMALFLLFCIAVAKLLYADLRNKRYLSLAGFLCMICFLLYFVGNVGYADINADATQQVSAGLASFAVPDWNYTGTAFLGYANRQYLLNAIPAFLFGRSIWTLHMGFAGLFLIGFAMLYMELREQLKKYELNESLALVPCVTILAFRFIGEYYMNFEQAITPVSLTMMGIALFLRLYRRMDVVTVLALTWVGCFFSDSYTPGLASKGLLLCFLALYGIDIYRSYRKERGLQEGTNGRRLVCMKMLILVGTMATMCSFFIATLIGVRKDRLTGIKEGTDFVSILEALLEFFCDRHVVFFGVFLIIVLAYMLLSLIGRLKFYDFVITVWTLGVVAFSELIKGYLNYEKHWLAQRNMIVIPVLVTAMFFMAVRIVHKHKIEVKNGHVVVLLLVLVAIAGRGFQREHQSFMLYKYIHPVKYMYACAEEYLEDNDISEESEFNVVLVTDSKLQSNIRYYALFFYPNADTYSMTTEEELPFMDPSKRTIIFSESEETLQRLGMDVESKTYEDYRYNKEVTWYYGELSAE